MRYGDPNNTEADYQDQFLTESGLRSFRRAMDDRSGDIEFARSRLRDDLDLEPTDVAEWDGDDPEGVDEPDFRDDEDGSFCYRGAVYVRAILKSGAVYYFEDGWDRPRFESCIKDVQEVKS